MYTEIRNAEPSDAEALADLWYDGWQDAHADLVPDELTRIRTRPAFLARVHSHASAIRVAGEIGRPIAMSLVQNDELYQFYVGAEARGTGLAGGLLADAHRQIAGSGASTGWLSCAIGNLRAARFYGKHGWRNVGEMDTVFDGETGLFTLRSWRLERDMSDVS